MSATLTVRIAADINSFSKNLTKVEKDFVRAAKRIESVGKDLSLAVTAPLLAMGAAFAKSAADDAASVDRLKRVFGGAANEMEGFIKNVMKTIPETDDALRELTGTTQNFLTQLGIAPRAAVGMTQTLTKLAGDMAAFNKVDVGTALDALEKGLAGKTKGLTTLGVVITDQMVKQEAYRLGLARVGEQLSQSATAHATLSLVMQKTTLQQGEAARTAGDASKSWAFMKQGLDNLADSMGSVLVPAFSAVIRKATDVANRIAELPTATKNVIVGIAGIAAVVGPTIYSLGALAEAVVRVQAALRALAGAGGIGLLVGTLGTVGLALSALVAPFLVYNRLMENSAGIAKASATDIDKFTASLYRLNQAQLIQKRLDIDSQLRTALTSRQALGTGTKTTYDRFGEATTTVTPAAAALDAKIKDLQAQGEAVGKVFQELTANIPGATTPAITAIDTVTGHYNQLREAAARVTEEMMQEKRDWWKGYIEQSSRAITVTDQLAEKARALRPELIDVLSSYLLPSIPEVSMPTVNVNDSLTKNQIKAQENLGIHVTSNADKNANLLRSTIESTTANLASVLVSALNIGGGGRASQIGGAFGGAIGFGVGTYAGAKIGGLLGSIVPGVGTVVGSLIGSALGGLFGHHKKAVDHNTEAVKALTAAMRLNEPAGFKVEPYRYAAAPALSGRRPPTPSASYNSVVIQGDVHVHDVQDPESFWDSVVSSASSIRARGGAPQLSLAQGSFR